MNWYVSFTNKAAKQAKKLNVAVLSALRFLVEDLVTKGPTLSKDWPNYRKLYGRGNQDKCHCHLIKGKTNLCMLLGSGR